MKALSVRAPWWWAILHGKPVENRDWHTNFRGVVLLHASKWWNAGEVRDDWDTIQGMVIDDGPPFLIPAIEPFDTKRALDDIRSVGGCIVGTVEIVDCVTVHPSAFFVGKYGFVLRNPMAFEKPIPFKGALGFFDVPGSVLLPGAAER